MSQFYTPGSDGFNVAVLRADDDHQVLLVERKTPAGEAPSDRPIYWGNDELGTLTPAEDSAVSTVLPLAVRQEAPGADVLPAGKPVQVHPLAWILMGIAIATLVRILA